MAPQPLAFEIAYGTVQGAVCVSSQLAIHPLHVILDILVAVARFEWIAPPHIILAHGPTLVPADVDVVSLVPHINCPSSPQDFTLFQPGILAPSGAGANPYW